MSRKRGIPDDLMENILSGNSETYNTSTSALERSSRIGITFNLPRQLVSDLDRLRCASGLEARSPSRSEVVEVALRIIIEDAKSKDDDSLLSRQLNERIPGEADSHGTHASSVERSVDKSGWVFETTFDDQGRVLDENVISNISELPVVDEYIDESGRLVSVARDELDNVYESVLDDSLKVVSTKFAKASSYSL